MRVLVVHTSYRTRGGEDVVFEKELSNLKMRHSVMAVNFTNRAGAVGVLQFLLSIWNISAATQLRNKIRDFQPDIIHVHNTHFAAGPIVIRAVKKYNVPLIATLHNFRLLCPSAILLNKGELFTESLKSRFPWKAIRKKVYRDSYLQTFWVGLTYWFHRGLGTWSQVDRYITLTEFSRDMFVRSRFCIDDDKVVVKPNFVQDVTKSNSLRSDTFLFVGRLSPEKGVKSLISAFENSVFKLRIAGDGPLKSNIQKSAVNNCNIDYAGLLNSDQVRTEMRQGTALVFPSIWYEGMPMTILEAFASGTPVIASKLGAMGSMITDGYNGLHFEPGNPEDLRKKIEMWHAMPEAEKEVYRKNARKTYEEFYTPEKNLEQLLAIYNSVIQEHKQKQTA